MRELKHVIADNLPTFAHCYKGYTEVTLPSQTELLEAANKIIAACQREGYQFYEYNPPKKT